MGQTPLPLNKLNNQWNFIDNIGGIEIYKNQHNQLAEKHVVKIDPKIDQKDYITAYYQRYLPTKPIANVYDAQFLQKSSSMCQNNSVISVFTEYIPHRLSDVKLLNHGQGIYVLSQALTGFSQLFGRVGPFQIHEDLIGFNQQGEVKVWYNPNFAENSVDNDRIILMSTINPYDFDTKFSQNQEHDMIEDIINSVARYTQFHPQFLQQAQELRKMNFAEARKILSNQIARKAYYVPSNLFLGDKNDIIKRSGVQIKNKYVVDPNKPKKGTKYPYFADGVNTNTTINQAIYNQNQGYANYDSDSQSSSNDFNYGGYYNLNGENYKIVATKEIEGNHISEQAIIDEITRNNNNSYNSQPQVYVQPPKYTQVSSNVYPQYQQPQPYNANLSSLQATQYIQRHHKSYQEGHISIGQNPQVQRSSQFSHVQNYSTNPQPLPQQQNVRVFIKGQNGKPAQQVQLGSSHHRHVQFIMPNGQSSVYQSNLKVSPHYQQSRVNIQGTHSTISPISFTQNVNSQIPEAFSHRHKIFEPTSPQRLSREQHEIQPQKAF